MNLHVVCLPHTTLTDRHLTCAYTGKTRRLGKMMRPLGYGVILYGPDEIDAECDEHVVITTAEDREKWGFGDGFDTVRTPFLWDPNLRYWNVPNQRAITEIQQRMNPSEDLLLLIAGNCQQPIAAACAPLQAVEYGVGYEGIFSNFRAFESYAWMHHVYGKQGVVNGRFYDTVIPNYFDPDDFVQNGDTVPGQGINEPSGEYLLFVGRLVQRKGPHIAALIAERAGLPIIFAGPGAIEASLGRIVAEETNGSRIVLEGDHVVYAGEVGAAGRAHLMAGATALLVPTVYIEPFGGVAVEAMMCGTPVIATDYGAFAETVVPGISGERFHTLQEGADAVEKVRDLDRSWIREWALSRYSLEAVGPQFDRWFQQIHGLWTGGWDT